MSCHSQLSTVVFVNTLDVYPPNECLNCKFTVNDEELQDFDETCWIGIFKVGWESIGDFVAKKCLPTKGETEAGVVLFSNNTDEICFDADEIPEENNEEFYQFCFITGKGIVLGASCPFQISQITNYNGSLSGSLLDLSANASVGQKKEDISDLEWCPWFEISGEDVDDTVFVHNKTTLLEKSLAKIIEENNNLRETIDQKECDIQNLNNELLEAQNQVSVTQDLLNDKRKQQISDIEQLDELQIGMETAKDTEQNLQKQIFEMNKALSILNTRLEESKEEIDALNEQLREADVAGREKCADYEIQLKQSANALIEVGDALQTERETLKDIQTQHQEELQTMTQSFNSVLSELASQNECVENLCLENKTLTNRLQHTHLTRDEEIRDLKDTVVKKEQMLSDFEKQIECLKRENQERLTDLEDKLEVQCNQSKEMEKLQDENATLRDFAQRSKEDSLNTQDLVKVLEDKVKDLKEDNFLLREKSDGHNGARHALQVAYVHTQRQLAQIKGDRDILAQQYQSIRQQSMDSENDQEVKELKKQVEDLKLRLCIGANAYKEKFVECKKLQAEIRRSTRISSKPSLVTERVSETMACSPVEMNCESRAFIPNRGNSKEFSAVGREGKIEMAKIGDTQMNTHAASRIMQLQDNLEVTTVALKKMEEGHQKSLFHLTTEIKKLQDEIKNKDAMFKDVKSKEQEAENEIKSLKEQLLKFQNPAQKFTRIHEQFYATSNEETNSSTSPIITHPQALTPPRIPQDQQLDQVKIYLPPNSLMKSPPMRCLTDPYCTTLRAPVSLESPVIGVKTPSGYPYLSESSKQATDVLQSTPALICPVCNIIFPSDYSDVAATNHVNSHFPETADRGMRR